MPDKTGSRAASTAHFNKLIVEWRQMRRLTRAEAARLLCCSVGTFRRWEAGRAMPRGFTLRAILGAIEGGALRVSPAFQGGVLMVDVVHVAACRQKPLWHEEARL